MIPPAPPDFWDRVIEHVAKLVWQRECSPPMATSPFVTAASIAGKTAFASGGGNHPDQSVRLSALVTPADLPRDDAA